VVSELVRLQPDARVLAWLDSLDVEDLAISSISIAELMLGIESLPDGKRKETLRTETEVILIEEFAERILPFDETAAHRYAGLACLRNRMGRPIGMADAQIAAICLSYNASLATRNTKDFEDMGLVLINPWLV
jgi:predicted nucleic acid-binding protein